MNARQFGRYWLLFAALAALAYVVLLACAVLAVAAALTRIVTWAAWLVNR